GDRTEEIDCHRNGGRVLADLILKRIPFSISSDGGEVEISNCLVPLKTHALGLVVGYCIIDRYIDLGIFLADEARRKACEARNQTSLREIGGWCDLPHRQ